MGICQMHPVVNSDGSYQSQPAVTQQTELDGDLVLHSQAEGSSSDSGLRVCVLFLFYIVFVFVFFYLFIMSVCVWLHYESQQQKKKNYWNKCEVCSFKKITNFRGKTKTKTIWGIYYEAFNTDLEIVILLPTTTNALKKKNKIKLKFE